MWTALAPTHAHTCVLRVAAVGRWGCLCVRALVATNRVRRACCPHPTAASATTASGGTAVATTLPRRKRRRPDPAHAKDVSLSAQRIDEHCEAPRELPHDHRHALEE